jgi:error-prone DNA polymerase
LGTRDSGLGTGDWQLGTAGSAAPKLDEAHSSSQGANPAPRYSSIADLIARTRVRRDELATLADIGALNAFGFDRRSALWQVERAVRPTGDLFARLDDGEGRQMVPPSVHARVSGSFGGAGRLPDSVGLPPEGGSYGPEQKAGGAGRRPESDGASGGGAGRVPSPESPLRPMSPSERLMADYAGTSLTIGPHPLALRRAELAMRGVLRASDLPHGRHGRRVRIAGAVITRQRPGTAKGFVFLTIEDETGIANVIVRPDLFTEQRRAIVGEPYLLVEGTLQIQEGVTSVKAERVIGLSGAGPEPQSHDFR